MQPIRFGGAPSGFVHPVIALAVLVGVLFIFLLPRKQVLVPFLVTSILVPMDQVIVVAGFHFQMIRLLILFGWIKVLMTQGSSRPRRWTGIDTAVAAWGILTAIDISILWQSSAAFQNQLGTLYTVLGLYFLLRSLAQGEETILLAIRTLAWTAAVIACIMVLEQATHHNPYAYIWAAAPQGSSVMERDGKFRAMACFGHPLLAGSFGGICLPLFFALWWRDPRSRRLAATGMAASTVIVWAANSSTPLLAYAGSLLALFVLWPLRSSMRILRWALVIVLTTLHLSMKAPVWALIARIDFTGSSSGYHRYQLVDQCIRHFSDWWLVGTKNYGDWGWDMWDLANQYVSVCETSGVLPFIVFVAIIVSAFKMIGKARKRAANRTTEHFIWALGAAMFANVVAFFGIAYYDQTMVVWYLLLAIIPVACTPAPQPILRGPLRPPTHSSEHAVMKQTPALV
jgi:hypothetical protein